MLIFAHKIIKKTMVFLIETTVYSFNSFLQIAQTSTSRGVYSMFRWAIKNTIILMQQLLLFISRVNPHSQDKPSELHEPRLNLHLDSGWLKRRIQGGNLHSSHLIGELAGGILRICRWRRKKWKDPCATCFVNSRVHVRGQYKWGPWG